MSFRVARFDNGRDKPATDVISNHRTKDAAQSAIDKADRRLQRRKGYENTFYQYGIQESHPVTFTDGTKGIEWKTIA